MTQMTKFLEHSILISARVYGSNNSWSKRKSSKTGISVFHASQLRGKTIGGGVRSLKSLEDSPDHGVAHFLDGLGCCTCHVCHVYVDVCMLIIHL